MSPIDENEPRGEDHRFDLLVDGELGETRRRELIRGLDDEPGGWRCCALAFLEAQTWKQDFGAMLREPAEKPSARRLTLRPRRGGYGGTVLAMAASFLVALFLGLMLREVWHRPAPTGPSPLQLADGTPPAQEPIRKADQPEGLPSEPSQRPDVPAGRWQLVDFPVPGDAEGESNSIRLPAVERDHLDEQWLRGLPVAIPPEVLQALERTGHRVDLYRELVPYRLQDGRQLVVPVDKVDVRYVGNSAQ